MEIGSNRYHLLGLRHTRLHPLHVNAILAAKATVADVFSHQMADVKNRTGSDLSVASAVS